jgi:hypothetical protein
MREAHVEWNDSFEFLDLSIAQSDGESFDVVMKMGHFSSSDDGKDIRCLLH